MMAEIELKREMGWVDRLRAYHVILDGSPIGEVRAGEAKHFEIEPGRHELELKIDWCRSRTVVLDLGAGSASVVRCRSRGPLTVLYGITFGRRDYIRLEVV
jgi:hypothetical protein